MSNFDDNPFPFPRNVTKALLRAAEEQNPPKPRFQPSDEISKEMRRRRDEQSRRTQEAAPRLKKWRDRMNTEPTEE